VSDVPPLLQSTRAAWLTANCNVPEAEQGFADCGDGGAVVS
jgi:hypothetical protein